MNIEKILEDLRKQGEEEINKIKEEYEKSMLMLKEDYEKRFKEIKEKWDLITEKEKKKKLEKLESELKLEIENLILQRKNKVLEDLYKIEIEKIKNLPTEQKQEFYKKEILKYIEKGDEVVHFNKELEKEVFSEFFIKRINELVKEKFGKGELKFVKDNENFIESKGYIVRVDILERFKVYWKESLLKISKQIFEEDEIKL